MRVIPMFVLALAVPVSLQAGEITVETVVLEGEAVAGVGNVTRIDNVAINSSGTTLVEVDTDFADGDLDGAMLRDGELYLREEHPLSDPPGSTIDSFDSVNLSEDGQSGWNLFLNGTAGTNDDTGVYLDTTLVIQEGDVSTSPVFAPGTRYIGFFDVKINALDQLMIVASVEDTTIASTVDRALVIADVDENGTLLTETVLAKEGDILPGQSRPILDFGTDPHESAFNDQGSILYLADLDTLSTADIALYLDLGLIAQEGGASPLAERNYEILSGRGNDLNNEGEFVFKANLDGATTDDEVLVIGSSGGTSVFRQEGGSIDAIAPFTFVNFGLSSGPVQIDDQGRVLYYAQWSDPNADIDSGLFLGDSMLVQEGVTEVDGVILDTIANGTDAFVLSEDGSWLIFEGVLVGGLEGAFAVQIPDDTANAPESGIEVVRLHLQARPNPFAGGVEFELGLEQSSEVRLEIFDAAGRRVAQLANGPLEAGIHRIDWARTDMSGRRLASGAYYARLDLDGTQISRKIVALH